MNVDMYSKPKHLKNNVIVWFLNKDFVCENVALEDKRISETGLVRCNLLNFICIHVLQTGNFAFARHNTFIVEKVKECSFWHLSSTYIGQKMEETRSSSENTDVSFKHINLSQNTCCNLLLAFHSAISHIFVFYMNIVYFRVIEIHVICKSMTTLIHVVAYVLYIQ